MSSVKSRTYRSIQNSVVGLVFYFANLILSFVSRKIYIDFLGTELLGLNTTAQNLLGFLNLAELGIGSAIACTLYKPLYEKDENAINEIVSLQGWLYRRIALIVGSGAIILMAFFPVIFAKTDLPIGYAYLSFGVFLVSSLLSYFINYQSIVLSANQKDYLIKGSYSAVMLVKIIVQIIAVRFFSSPYIWWCVFELVFSLIASLAMHSVVMKDAPYLRTSINEGKRFRRKYPEVITKVKQLFFHKVGGVVLTQSGSIMLYAFTNLTTVALVGNYNAVLSCVRNLVSVGIGSLTSSVGNLVSEGDRDRTMSVFEELFSVRFLIAGVVCFGFYLLASPFVSLWLGSEYVLDQVTVFLLTLSVFITFSRSTVDDFIQAKGLFQDIWAPIAEAAINICSSVVLGYYFGLNGVLAGGIVSQFFVILIWKPFFLFSVGLQEPVLWYFRLYLKHLILVLIVAYIASVVLNIINICPSNSFFSWVLYGVVLVCICGMGLVGPMYLLTNGMRSFVSRIKAILKQKINFKCN